MMKYVALFLLISAIFFSQQTEMIPVKKGNLWGFSDKNLKIIIDPQYEEAFPFESYRVYDSSTRKYKIVKLAKVYKDKKLKCIDEQNSEKNCTNLSPYRTEDLDVHTTVATTEVSVERPKVEDKVPDEIQKNYEKAETFYLEPLIFLVKKDGKKGLVDEKGKIIVPVKFDFIDRNRVWSNSKIHEVFFTATSYQNSGSSTYFDVKGNLIIQSFGLYSSVDPYNNFIVIKDKKGKLKIYNMLQRKFINNKFYDRIENSFYDGKVLVERDKKQFYIDVNGKEFILK